MKMEPCMKRLVVDASIAIKWSFHEPLSEKAGELLVLHRRQKVQIVVPEFFYCEFASVCWKKVKMKLSTVKEAIQALEDTDHLSFRRYSDHELSDVALDNALLYNISIYDALYLSLAEIYVAPLITADETLVKACRGRFDFIESLRDVRL